MSILITGSNGFLGTHLKDVLDHKVNWERSTFDETLYVLYDGTSDSQFVKHYKKEDCIETVKKVRPHTIFHFAGNPLVKTDNFESLLRDNVLLTEELLKAAPERGTFVFASSATVYGKYDPIPTENSPLTPTSLYAVSKIASESLILAYSKLKGIKPVILRMAAVVGGGMTHGAIFDIVNKLYSSAPELELLGNAPGSTKPYLYINSLLDVIFKLYALNRNGIFNISPTSVIDVEDMALLAMQETGIHKKIKWLGEKANWAGDNKFVSISSIQPHTYIYKQSKEAIRLAIKDLMNEKL